MLSPLVTLISVPFVVFPTAKVAAKSCAAGISLVKATVPEASGIVQVLFPVRAGNLIAPNQVSP